MQRKLSVVVICGLVRDFVELARLNTKYNFIFDNTFDWVEHTFAKGGDSEHDILADIDQFVKTYSDKHIDAIFSSCDHGVAIAAILASKMGLPCSDPKSCMLTHHKYYQRVQLAQAVPNAVPRFRIMDPKKVADYLLHHQHQGGEKLVGEEIPAIPFFMKPVKSVLSSHAYKIGSEEDLVRALTDPLPPATFLREFFKLIKLAVGDVEYDCCKTLCEELITGEQFTVDGFVYDNKVTILGIVDSIMYPGTMSFASFEYPSKLPQDVQENVKGISEKAIQGLGLTNTTFNIEYFYNPTTGDLKIIEVNPRFSGQFGDIYEKVDGTNTYDIAVGIPCLDVPTFVPCQGKHRVAASFVMRVFSDKKVKSVPTQEDILKVQELFEDAKVFVLVEKDTKLSDYIQDSGSFRYCLVHLGSSSFGQLYKDYETCRGLLRFDLV